MDKNVLAECRSIPDAPNDVVRNREVTFTFPEYGEAFVHTEALIFNDGELLIKQEDGALVARSRKTTPNVGLVICTAQLRGQPGSKKTLQLEILGAFYCDADYQPCIKVTEFAEET